MNSWLYLLLLAAPAAVLTRALHASPLLTFVLAALGIVPLAGLIGQSTDVLLVLGTAMLVGGWRYRRQQFQPRVAGRYAAMLVLAVIGMAIPSLLATIGESTRPGAIVVQGIELHELSIGVALILLLCYAAYIAYTVFGLRAPQEDMLSLSTSKLDNEARGKHDIAHTRAPAVEVAMRKQRNVGLSPFFVGLIILPIVAMQPSTFRLSPQPTTITWKLRWPLHPAPQFRLHYSLHPYSCSLVLS